MPLHASPNILVVEVLVHMDSHPIHNYNPLYAPPREKIYHNHLPLCHPCQFFHRSEELEKYLLKPRSVSVLGKGSKKDMNFSIL